MIGVDDVEVKRDKKRIRLLNGICVMAIGVLAIYCIMYSAPRYRLTFLESFFGLVAYGITLLLNYQKKYNSACHFFCIYNVLSYSFQAISHGSIDAAEYILVANSISTLLFFKSMRIILIYFILNMALFFFCKWAFDVIKPFLFMADGENLYISNHIILFVITFLIVYYFKVENDKQEQLLNIKNKSLAEEKEKSDDLLLNILPYETAEELKATGSAKAKSFELVTILFTDFKHFTTLAERLSPADLVKEIDECFSAFDAIIENHGIEKIKTIGDSYMCAGGLPNANTTNPIDAVNAALEIRQFMQLRKEAKQRNNEPFFEVRIGIHSGPVVAGIVGTKKFAYDIWGDTVNTASRMESSSEVGKINVSDATYELIQDKFICVPRGKIEAKNKGMIEMYFVEERRT